MTPEATLGCIVANGSTSGWSRSLPSAVFSVVDAPPSQMPSHATSGRSLSSTVSVLIEVAPGAGGSPFNKLHAPRKQNVVAALITTKGPSLHCSWAIQPSDLALKKGAAVR